MTQSSRASKGGLLPAMSPKQTSLPNDCLTPHTHTHRVFHGQGVSETESQSPLAILIATMGTTPQPFPSCIPLQEPIIVRHMEV